MPVARGLTDTRGDRDAVFVLSAAGISSTIKAGKYATAADSNGAIGVWIDDKGQIRGEAMRHLRTIDSQTFKTIKAAKEWYVAWLKKIA